MFKDRLEAGQKLGAHLRRRLAERGPEVVVLGVPRGGVIVAGPVAEALEAPLDVIVPRKLGAPGESELTMGALALAAEQDILLLDDELVQQLAVSPSYVEEEVERQRREIARREAAYRAGRPPLALASLTVVIVDDGIATGMTVRAAGRAVAASGPRDVIVAVPVAPADARQRFAREKLRLEALETPSLFLAVGQFYLDFRAVEDAEVLAVLRAHRRP